jgi:hypothetical protein
MRFWGERLIAYPNACTLTIEMLEAFNHWLQVSKHNPWLKETLGPRRSSTRDGMGSQWLGLCSPKDSVGRMHGKNSLASMPG